MGLQLLVIVTPHFNLNATAAFIDPFRASNYLDGRNDFEWQLVSPVGGKCIASNGVVIETTSLSEVNDEKPDFVIVSSSWTPENHVEGKLRSSLRRWAKGGAVLGALDTGAFILAAAGLLNRRCATVHYEHIDAFRELYPEVDVSEELFVFNGDRISCCGGSACTEFALYIIQSAKGEAAANAAARYIFHGTLRPHGSPQNPDTMEPLGNTVPEAVRNAIRIMEENLEEPMTIPEICDRVALSHRQMDRLFSKFVKKTPALYYRDIRLDRARGLVTQTELSISEIAHASGFASHVHFSRAYRERFGLAPRSDRIEGRIPFEFRAWPMHRRER